MNVSLITHVSSLSKLHTIYSLVKVGNWLRKIMNLKLAFAYKKSSDAKCFILCWHTKQHDNSSCKKLKHGIILRTFGLREVDISKVCL
jgi:hypothetical protein